MSAGQITFVFDVLWSSCIGKGGKRGRARLLHNILCKKLTPATVQWPQRATYFRDSLSFEHTTPENYHAVKLAITELSDIQSAFATVFGKFRRVDLVNNVGYSRHFEEL